MQASKYSLKKYLKRLKLMVCMYGKDTEFLKYLYQEIARVEAELKQFSKKK